eukprot:CAMPEP_0170958804 /NCGR_PEP_ID=MMETSP0735-20130129/35920_1 /TAXON_ID=186038 /ORGANISM="Fragilariopsis kerguelensis, Strain L26-C5" /LENGTH=157 /DNA_ID=CAMNT_0011372791 /DNA_START=125 /DNA_END=595 /DNA_ORIENTATION=+
MIYGIHRKFGMMITVVRSKRSLTKLFPRFDMNQIIAEEEWKTFASSQGSRFPPCQYSPSLYVSSSSSNTKNSSGGGGGGAGVVLVGDALHSFPPDIGQGVNAALSDVMMLGQCFQDALRNKKNNKYNSDSSSSSSSPTTTATTSTAFEKSSSSVSSS